jgi:predicted Zn finger-like uncharacterized protein
MILTCPDCASRYFIDDQLIGPAGKTVRCSSCGTSWKARREDEPLDLVSLPEEGAMAAAARAEPEAAAPQLSELPADRVAGAFRAKAEQKRRIVQAAAAGAVWAVAAAVVALVLALLAIFRSDVVRALPKTATAYAAVGLAVNTTGINIEKVEASPGLQDGRAAVVVSGALRNIARRPVVAPALRINLLNKAGKIVQSKIAAPADPKIPAGESRHFTITLLDPPSSASDVEVVFQAASPATKPPRPHAPAKAAAPPPPADLRHTAPAPPPPAAEVEDAKPLVGAAPYALPKP